MSKKLICLGLISFFCLTTTEIFGDESVNQFKMSQIYSIDRGHSYVGFSIKYMGFAKVRGRFKDFSGTLRYDENDIMKTSATIIIKTESIDTDHGMRDKDLKSKNWFDVEKFPIIKFQSKEVIKGESGVEIVGELTIKDVTKVVTLKLESTSGVQKDIRGDTQVIFTGYIRINRKDFGVQGERWSRVKEGITAVDSEVDIELSILGKQINAANFRNWVRNEDSPQGRIYKIVSENGVKNGITEFNRMNLETEGGLKARILNIVGYMLLKERKIDDSIEIFKLNAELFPDNANVYDSLGEAYAVKGDNNNAIRFYQIALDKNPINSNALEILRHLKSN